jgi:cell division GTPase FtsZ
MRIGIIGIGRTGTKAVDAIAGSTRNPGGRDAGFVLAVDADERTLESLDHVSPDRRLLVGEQKVKGHGTGADLDLGREVVETDLSEIQRELDGLDAQGVDTFVILAGLADSTGGGGAPVLADHIAGLYLTPDIYGIGVRPDEGAGRIYLENADRALQPFVTAVDSALVLTDDDGIWSDDGSERYGAVIDRIDRTLRSISVFT